MKRINLKKTLNHLAEILVIYGKRVKSYGKEII